MCAIVGGVVASEVIKVISGKGAPINNAFFFDALHTSEGPSTRGHLPSRHPTSTVHSAQRTRSTHAQCLLGLLVPLGLLGLRVSP